MKKSFRNGLLGAFVLILVSSMVSFAKADDRLNTKNVPQIVIQAKYSLMTVDDFEKRGVITSEVATAERERFLLVAETAVGKKIGLAGVFELGTEYESKYYKPGIFNVMKEYIAGVDTWLFFASLFIVIGGGGFFFVYIFPILYRFIPKFVYEVIIYGVCIALINQGHSTDNIYLGVIGSLGLLGALIFTNYIHERLLGALYDSTRIDPVSINALILTFAWAYIAILLKSKLIGLFAVIAFETFLGFSVLVLPLCYCIGFRDKQVIPRAMMTSVFLLLIYFPMASNVELGQYFQIFSKGIWYMATFVYFIGLLIVSSRYYLGPNDPSYLAMQLLFLVSGLAAIYLSTILNIPELRGIGGTFFMLWIIEKYTDWPGLREHWLLGTFGLGLLMYGLGMFAKAHPAYFLLSA